MRGIGQGGKGDRPGQTVRVISSKTVARDQIISQVKIESAFDLHQIGANFITFVLLFVCKDVDGCVCVSPVIANVRLYENLCDGQASDGRHNGATKLSVTLTCPLPFKS